MKEAQPGTIIRLREILSEMTSAERKVADFIIQNTDEVIRISITELAQKSLSSEATIVRLCKKLGLRGYQDLKVTLAQDLVSPVKQIHEMVSLSDSADQLLRKVFQAATQALSDTESILSNEDLVSAIRSIESANSITFFGIGASGVIAQDAYYRFSKLGITCHVATDGHSQSNKAVLLKKNDVVVAISHSGCTRDIVRTVDIAKRQGACTIAITQFGHSPITDVADIVLHTSSRETAFRSEAMASRIAQCAILDAIFVGVSLSRYEEVINNYERARESTKEMRINNIKELYKNA